MSSARPHVLPLAIPALSVCVLIAGCSGAEPQDVLESPSGAAGASGGTTSGGTTSGGTTSGGTTSGGTTSGGTTGTCAQEREPNDDEDDANELAPAVCGAISDRNDVDFLTFRLGRETKSMAIRYTGKVTLKVEVDGHPSVTLGGGRDQQVPFVRERTYTIEIRSDEREMPVPWRVELVEQ